MSATSRTRSVEYTALVADNLADKIGSATATAADIATADVIVCMDNKNVQLTSQRIRESLGENYNGQMIITTTPTTLYGLTMNSVENAMGLGYIVGYMYSDVLPIDPVEMCAYFYQRFYHISDMDNLKTVVQTNFAGTELPEYCNAALTDDYSTGKVEDLLIQGMLYYVNNPEDFANTYIEEAGWEIDWNSGIGSGLGLTHQTITGVDSLYNKTYKEDQDFTLEAVTDGDGTISYELVPGFDSAVKVDGTTGLVTIQSAGTAKILIKATGTDSCFPAEKVVTINVVKRTQLISGVESTYNKVYGDKAFTLGAATNGDGAISYELVSGSAVKVDGTTGLVTILSAGTAEIIIKASETEEYSPAENTITINVAKKAQSISGVSSSYNKKATASAFNLGAKATGGTVTYSSGNTSVASVNNSGKVTIKGAGTAKITITAPESTNYQKATKTISIKVTRATQKITLKKASVSYKSSALSAKKKTFKINASAKGKLGYKVASGKKYISVNKNGKVTVKKGTPKGTYKVTVSAAATAKYKKAASKTVKITVK